MAKKEKEAEAREQERLEKEARVNALGLRLQSLLNTCRMQRSPIEQRWLKDQRQYEGRYDPQTEAIFAEDKTRSRVFINVTRVKCHAAEARLGDMLFPTDDKNWAIRPTPVPEMAATEMPQPGMGQQHVGNQMLPQVPNGQDITASQEMQPKDEMAEARERAAKMEREIEDQLRETNYAVKARAMIHDAVVLGTGILKGPNIVGRAKRTWTPVVDEESGLTEHVLTIIEEKRPGVERVSPWDFYPDHAAATLEEAEYVFERHWMTKKELRKLAKLPGFMTKQIATILQTSPKATSAADTYIAQRREISGLTTTFDKNTYEVFEYHGPIEREDLEACGCEFEGITEDELAMHTFEGVVWFVDNVVIKATLEPLETNDLPYSVFNWQSDDTSIFGKGVPYQMRNSQSIINATWRMMMENAGLSVGPQIVMDKNLVEPADGKPGLTPRKLWYKIDPNRSVGDVFGAFHINSHQQELLQLYEFAKKISDEETNLPSIDQQDQVGRGASTLGGMTMLMNAANVVLRRAVRNFDDTVTLPLISRFYDWNMQFGTDPSIKGDFSVDARGSSVLLVREQQSQNLMALASTFAGHPVFGPMTKASALYRKLVQAFNIPADDVVKSDEEIQQLMEQQANQEPQKSPEELKLELQYQMHKERIQDRERERQMKLMETNAERELKLMELASHRELSAMELQTRLEEMRMKTQSEWDKLLGEAQIKAKFGSGI